MTNESGREDRCRTNFAPWVLGFEPHDERERPARTVPSTNFAPWLPV